MLLTAEFRRILNTCIWSWQGFAAAWATEKSLRQWVLINLLSAILAFTLDLTTGERALILALGVIIIATELLNTAIEEIVDLTSPERNPRAGKAKDCGSAAVAAAGIAGLVAWLIILFG